MIDADVAKSLAQFRREASGAHFLGEPVERMNSEQLLGLVGYLRTEIRTLHDMGERQRRMTELFLRVCRAP